MLSASPDLGTIGPRVDYGPAIDVQPGDPIPLVTMPPEGGWAWSGNVLPWDGQGADYWSISAALTQTNVWAGDWPTFVGVGEWTVFHAHYDADSPMNYSAASIQRFTLPHAESVGLSLSGGTVTVYQVAFGALWSTSTADDGLNWTAWQQVASLTPQNVGTAPPNLAPFGWLADFDRYEPGPDLDGDGWPDAPGVEHAKYVYGTILVQPDGIRVGYEIGGQRFSGYIHDGALTTEAIDALFLEGVDG